MCACVCVCVCLCMCACAYVCMCVLYDFEEGAFTKKMYVLLSCLRIAAYYFLLRRLFFHSKKPYTIPKESYFLSKEPYLLSKEPYLLSKELYLFSKEPCLLSEEPNLLPKEPYLQETSGQHVRATARNREKMDSTRASEFASKQWGWNSQIDSKICHCIFAHARARVHILSFGLGKMRFSICPSSIRMSLTLFRLEKMRVRARRCNGCRDRRCTCTQEGTVFKLRETTQNQS